MSTPGPWEHTTYDGNEVDQATRAALMQMAKYLYGDPFALTVTQGHNVGYGPSGGTHDGWTMVDLLPADWEDKLYVAKWCGFMIWHRPELPGEWPEHLHGGLLDNPGQSYEARKQQTDYVAGLNGLASHGPDLNPYRAPNNVRFAYPLKTVHLGEVIEHIENGAKNPRPSVKVLQWAMNRRMGAGLLVDGIYGKQTREMFKRFERQNGGDGDGIPGGLTAKLGLASFNVED